MTRSERLLKLIQLLHEVKYPISANKLADELGINLRTIYRDIEILRNLGADIVGIKGLGYQLKDGFLLPPLMFTQDEIDALVLGIKWVVKNGDYELIQSAYSVQAKVAAILPPELQENVYKHTLLVASYSYNSEYENQILHQARESINKGYKAQIVYSDADGNYSERIIHPFAITFFKDKQILVAWCESRQDFRSFRIDRIQKYIPTELGYLYPKEILLKKWYKQLYNDK